MTPPDGLYLADTSALARSIKSDAVRGRLEDLANDGLLATCVTVDLELGFAARDPREFAALTRRRKALLVDLPMNVWIAERARTVQGFMARRSQHRAAGALDLLTAATAECHGATVLHYDGDFDHIAATTGQPTEWIAERGSLD